MAWVEGTSLVDAAGTVLAFVGLTPGSSRVLSGAAVTSGFLKANSANPLLVSAPVKGPTQPSAGTTLNFTITETLAGKPSSPKVSNLVLTVSGTASNLSLSGTLAYQTDTVPGTVLALISGVPTGVTPTVTPANGKVAIGGSAGTGWKLVTGLTAGTVGTITYTVAATGATPVNADVVVSAPSMTVNVVGSPTYNADTPAGAVLATLTGIPAGSMPILSPADGRVVVGGQESIGWWLARGATASPTATSYTLSISATGANPATTTVTATGPTTYTAKGTFTVTETSASALTNYPVKLVIPYKSGINATFTNLRFFDTDGLTILPFWTVPETVIAGSSATVWVKFPTLAASAARSGTWGIVGTTQNNYSDGTSVFDLFDEFEATSINASKWSSTSVGQGWTELDRWRLIDGPTGLATGAGQGIAADGNFLYVGKDNGSGVNGTVYKYDYSGNPGSPASFASPPHSNTGDFRLDTGNMIWSSSGDPTINTIWEISPAGVKVRSWNFGTDLFYPNNCQGSYYGPGQALVMSASSVTQIALQLVTLNNDGTYVIGKKWQLDTTTVPIGRLQSFKYLNGYVYVICDDGTGTTDYGQVMVHVLNHDGTTTIVDRWKHLVGGEREGITHDGTNWLMSTHAGNVYTLKIGATKAATMVTTVGSNINDVLDSVATFGAGYALFTRAWMNGNFPALGFYEPADANLMALGKYTVTDAFLKGLSRKANTTTLVNYTGATDYKNYHAYEVRRLTSSVEFYMDGASMGTPIVTNIPTVNMKARIGGSSATGGTGYQAGYEYVGVRKLATTEPTVTVA